MKIRFAHVAAAILISLTACGDSVPDVADPRNIVVDGQAMSGMEFVKKYCADKVDHATCVKVRRAIGADSTRSKGGVPRF